MRPAEAQASVQDRIGRTIDYLRLSVTDRCNLRCRYCVPPGPVSWSPREDHLTNGEIARLVSLIARRGVSKVRITGGEPLVRPGIVDLVRDLSRITEIADLPMTTNGLLLERHAEALKASGLARVNVSLDTLDPETFRRITGEDALEKVWAGIDAAIRAGLAPIKINMVVQRGINDHECATMARLTLDRPLHVRMIEYMPVADYALWARHHVSNADRRTVGACYRTDVPCEGIAAFAGEVAWPDRHRSAIPAAVCGPCNES